MTSLNKNRQSGFTIVELLIVIVIIGILAALVITQILGATQQARDTDRKNSINSINTQLEAYRAQKGAYPAVGDINSASWREKNNFNAGDSAKALKDPMGDESELSGSQPTTTNRVYGYIAQGDAAGECISPTDVDGDPVAGNHCTSYNLIALLENKSDSQKDGTITTDGNAFYVKRNSN